MGPRAPDWGFLESLDPSELEEEDVEKVNMKSLKVCLCFDFVDL